MAGKEIRVVAGDRGGWDALEPPLQLALNAGCVVSVYFTATCGKQLSEGKLKPDKRINVQVGPPEMPELIFFLKSSRHQLTVVGASQSEEGVRAAATALVLSHSVPRLSVQDTYGSSIPTLEIGGAGIIECLCVTDEFARTMVLQKYPKLSNRIVVTGGPQFDKTLAVKKTWQKQRERLRALINANSNDSVFLVAGGLNGTAETLELLEAGIEQSGISSFAKVIVRAHPRATDEDKRLVAQYMEKTTRRWFFKDIDNSLGPTSDSLLPGIDFVLSGYSTTNYFGILYGIPGVVYVGTPAFKRDLLIEKGLKRPPEVEIGAGWYVQNGADMADVIMKLRPGAQPTPEVRKLTDAQALVATYNDGNAAQRVWEQMQRLMA